MTEDNIIAVKNLNKSFEGKPAVINVSLNVKRGEIFGFMGPNGSGKTTTIRMLCGLMTPDSGTGECLGYNILTQSSLIKPLIGYVPQIFSLYQDLTVTENLMFMARIYNMENDKECVKKIMTELELNPYQNILAGRLSGGWKQRLSLAAALIHDPQLLLLDEPTAGVDPKARREFWNYISYLTTKGISSLVSTHYMDEAERCHRLAYIVYGHLKAEGTMAEIIHQAHLTVWSVQGDDKKALATLAKQLQQEPGVEQVVAWGNVFRIVGTDAVILKKIVDRYKNFTWEEVDPSLEEIFIHLVSDHTSKENAA